MVIWNDNSLCVEKNLKFFELLEPAEVLGQCWIVSVKADFDPFEFYHSVI